MLILRTLLYGPSHGHQIGKHIQRTTNDVLQMQHGSLYPALHRLEKRGWVCLQMGDGSGSQSGIQVLPDLRVRAENNLWSKNRNGSRWRKLSHAYCGPAAEES